MRGIIIWIVVANVGAIREISARRLIVGGAAMLLALRINNIKVIEGNRARSPLVKKRFRV